jgi:hypothetical protein
MSDYPSLILGADVGTNGGIALIGDGFAEAHKMPQTRKDLIELIAEYAPSVTMAYVEKVRSSPQMGVVSAFTFGCNYERVVMALMCAYIPVEEVSPQKWQKALNCQTHGNKNVSKARAQQLFPKLKITHATADSLLIAEYGRRLNA